MSEPYNLGGDDGRRTTDDGWLSDRRRRRAEAVVGRPSSVVSAPILTVTPNTALDRTVVVPRLTLNRTVRISDRLISASGKGVDVSRVLREMDVDTLAMGFVAGETGRQLQALLTADGVPHAFIEAGGETRLNIVVIGAEEHSHTTLADDALVVSAAQVQQLIQHVQGRLGDAACLVLAGSLPKGVSSDLYAQLIHRAHAHGVPVILDAVAGRHLLETQPTWIKPNREELEVLVGASVRTMHDALAGAQALNAQFGVNVLASLDAQGAIAVTRDGAWRAEPLAVPVVSPAGAGDAMVAGLAASLVRGDPIEEGLRLGTAAAAATVMQRGTAQCDRADVLRLLGEVRVKRMTN